MFVCILSHAYAYLYSHSHSYLLHEYSFLAAWAGLSNSVCACWIHKFIFMIMWNLLIFIVVFVCLCLCRCLCPAAHPQVAWLRPSARGSATATSQVWLLLVAFRLLFLYVLNHLQWLCLYLYLYLELYLYIFVYLQHCCICACQLPHTGTHKHRQSIRLPGDPRPHLELSTCSRIRTRHELSRRNGLSSTCCRFA